MDTNSTIFTILSDLKIVQRIFKKRMHNHFKDLDLTAPQGMLVFIVHKHESLKISQISNKMGLSNSTVSGIVDRLEGMGFVERKRSETDRRVVNVQVTKKMSERILSHEDLFESILSNALSNASKEEIKKVASGLSILSNLLQEELKETHNA